MSQTILVVDDERKLVQVLRGYLEQAGFRVVTASTGKEALAAFRHDSPDLILLDLTLPEMDGLDVARTIRQESSVPLIMVTARVEETDRLVGLELGADDYISKPFSPREVVARVRAVLRRGGQPGPLAPLLRAGELMLDPNKHVVTHRGVPVDLTPTEFALLAALLQSPGRAFSRAELVDRALGKEYEGYDRTIDAHIKNLRQKLGDDPRRPRYILTVFGIGYKFSEETG